MFGFLNINKPQGITSFDVIAKLRKILKIKQIGHAGTLDPLATGVLPIAIGKCTRLIEYLNSDKAYICECEFGKVSNTYDLEGEVTTFSNAALNEGDVKEGLKFFQGEIEQIPPMFSAVHHNGKRLYELARKGEMPTDIKKRNVTIYEINLTNFDEKEQKAVFYVKCSSGTYIRTIVHDLGQNLKTGAVMTKLERVSAAGMSIENSITLKQLQQTDNVEKYLINPLDVLSYKRKVLSENEYKRIASGMAIDNSGEFTNQEPILLVKDSNLAAIAIADEKQIKVKKVLV